MLAGNGVKAYLYKELMPVPALSFATRHLHCDAGIMVTASHNPAKYNGYKAYGPDGCQMTSEAADAVYAEMQATDILRASGWRISTRRWSRAASSTSARTPSRRCMRTSRPRAFARVCAKPRG